MDAHQLLHEFEICFSSIYLYILTYEQKGKRRRTCDIVLNAAANYTTGPVRKVMFARVADFLSLLKSFTSYVKSKDQNSKPMRNSTNKRERITLSGGSARKNSICKNVTF